MYIYNIFLEVWYSMSLTDLFNVNNSLNIIKLSAHVFMSLNGLTFISKLCYADNGFFLYQPSI